MSKFITLFICAISASLFLTCCAHAEAVLDIGTKDDQHALVVGRAVLRLAELGGAGAPLMGDQQKTEFERNVKFLSETKSGRMIWAWLEFRFRSDSQLRLEGNPGAEAIKQRLGLFKMLIRKYFVLE